MALRCSILVLNYNGLWLLQRFLETVTIAASRSRICDTRVVLVDNQSSDGSVEWVNIQLPQTKIYLAPINRYLYTLNDAVKDIDTDVVVLLNNDIEMTPDCLEPLFDGLLANPDAFSITPQCFAIDRQTPNSGRFLGRFVRGLLTTKLDNSVATISNTMFGSGGALAIRRSSFIELGGFDNIYYPIYWEDVDLAYRAWKRKLPSLYQPASIMYHVHSATMGDPKYFTQKDTLLSRNCWLLTWRNVTDTRILAANLYWTTRYYYHALVTHDQQVAQMYRDAFSLRKQAIKKRVSDEPTRLLSDRQIIDEVNLTH